MKTRYNYILQVIIGAIGIFAAFNGGTGLLIICIFILLLLIILSPSKEKKQ